MTKLLALLLFTLMSIYMQAQLPKSPAGEYYLTGVMETGSGFKLNADSTFEFFFSQGALDRMGKGTWTLNNNQLILNSAKKPARDFALISSKKVAGNFTIIKVTDPNVHITKYVYAIVNANGKSLEQALENEGQTTFNTPSLDSLTLLFEFCPEKSSVFTDLQRDHNFFEFRFEPWIVEYHFTNFTLTFDGDNLTGPHPLLQPKQYTYEKAGTN